MESVLRAAVVYAFLIVVFRVTGKRLLAQITSFDFVLLLIIGEATQQALLGEDYSVVNAWIVIGTLMFLELTLSFLKQRLPALDRIMEGLPLVIVEDGRLIEDRAVHERLDVHDVLAAARERHGLERLDQIKYAVLERSGGISIIPKAPAKSEAGGG
jgi:uncharacterized membrane protein YcaP (DUF421 family)